MDQTTDIRVFLLRNKLAVCQAYRIQIDGKVTRTKQEAQISKLNKQILSDSLQQQVQNRQLELKIPSPQRNHMNKFCKVSSSSCQQKRNKSNHEHLSASFESSRVGQRLSYNTHKVSYNFNMKNKSILWQESQKQQSQDSQENSQLQLKNCQQQDNIMIEPFKKYQQLQSQQQQEKEAPFTQSLEEWQQIEILNWQDPLVMQNIRQKYLIVEEIVQVEPRSTTSRKAKEFIRRCPRPRKSNLKQTIDIYKRIQDVQKLITPNNFQVHLFDEKKNQKIQKIKQITNHFYRGQQQIYFNVLMMNGRKKVLNREQVIQNNPCKLIDYYEKLQGITKLRMKER